MAARRLVIAMVILLTVSTTIAILAPSREVKTDEKTASGTTATTGASSTSGESGPTGNGGAARSSEKTVADSGGEIVRATVASRASHGGQRATELAMKPGDRLILNVNLGKPARIAIPGLGLTGDTTRYSPATFDILIQSTVPQKVIDVDSGKVLANIVVGIEDRD